MSATTIPHTAGLTQLVQELAEACVEIPVAQGPAAIARELARIAPHYAFRETLSRGGWYRLGGVVGVDSQHVADNIERWLADELASHDEDLAAVAAAHEKEGLRATRLIGKTHYWVARTGSGAADFVQVEIEELQEVACHTLFADGKVPASTEELVDPRDGCTGDQIALGLPFYQLRRVTAIADYLAAMRAQKPEPQPIHRFIADWERSSAGHASDFSNHWVLAIREHLDRYRQPIRSATPVVALNGTPPRFEIPYGAHGLSLAAALQQFDKQLGYPLSWFFHMLTTKVVPHAVATVVIEDMQAGYGYLPDRDVQVVRDWLHQPYGF